MKNKDKSCKKSKSFAYNSLIICACIGTIVILLVNLGLAIRWGVYGIPNGDSTDASLLSTGIGIIGFAIAIWATLNIANIVNRKEIDALNQEVDNLKGTTTSEIRPFVAQSRAVLSQQFLVELERAQDDAIAQYFAEQFRNISDDKKDTPYAKLIEIEMLNAQVALRHKSAYIYDEVLINLADKGLARIEEIQNCTQAKEYLIYRKADFLFYKGYCDKDRVKSAKNFWRSVTVLTSELGYDSFKEKLNNNRAVAYWDNMIGEAYSKIVIYYEDVCKKGNASETNRFEEEFGPQIEYIAAMAIQYCEKAVQRMPSSTYYRNLGCAYERKDRVFTLKGKEKYANSSKIIETYLLSVSKSLNDYSIANDTALNAFSVLLKYYKGYLDHRIKYCDSINPVCAECKDHISNMYAYAFIAKHDFPRHMMFHKLYAFSCYYVFRALKANVNIDAVCGKPFQYFRWQFEDTMILLKSADTEQGKGDGYTIELEDILQAIGYSK